MKLNTHTPRRLLHPASEYVVTHRSVEVSERTMAHGVGSDFQGMLRISHTPNEQARAPKSQQSSPDLTSRTRAASPAVEDEVSSPAPVQMQSFSAPPASAPRKARATQAAKPPSPLGTTQRSVNRTIGRPQDRMPASGPVNSTKAAEAEKEPSQLSDSAVSAIMQDVTHSSASPIADQRVRRRDGQSSVISKGSTKQTGAKTAPEASRKEPKALESASGSDAPSATPAPVSAPALSRNGVPVPPELAPAPVAKEEPVAPAEIPLVTRKRSRDSLADPVAVAEAKKISAVAAVAEVEAKAASSRARDMTPVQARPLGSSTRGTYEDSGSSNGKIIAGSIIESTNTSRRESDTIPSGSAAINSARRTAPNIAPVDAALETAIVEPSQSAPEEIALSARSSAPESESTNASAATESRSASVPTAASTAGVQRRASDTQPAMPATTTPAATPQSAQGSSPSAGITAEGNGSTAATGTPAQAQGSTPSDGTVAQAQGSTVSPSIPASSETVRPRAANDAPEVALTARSTPHVDTVAAGSSPAAGFSAPANGSSTPASPAMTTNTSTSATPTPAEAHGSTASAGTVAEAHGSTASAGTVAEAHGSTAAAGVVAEAQGSTARTTTPRTTDSVRARDIADAPEVALTARSTPHVDTFAAGSSPVASASSLSSAGVQRRASTDSGSAPAPTVSPSDSVSSAESAPSISPRESVRASESPEASDVELVSRSSRESSAPTAATSTSAPVHVDPVPAASATSHSVPADVRAAVAAIAGSAPQSMSLKRGAHVDAHASAIKADAFTAKGTVHVPGTAPLTSDSSRRLLAHELTHVMQQQRHGSRLPAENTPAGRALEAEALRAEGLISTPSAHSGAVAGMPPFSSGSSSPSGGAPSARTSSPSAGTPAVAQGSSPSSGMVARANGSSAAAGNPAAAQGSTAAAGTPAIARGSSPTAPAPIELAPRRAPRTPEASADPNSQTQSYSGGGSTPPGMPPVQRRASGTPPQGSTYDSNMPDIKEAGKVAKATPPSQNSAAAQQPPPDNTWRDQRWLEQHATALYPLIRGLLRDELLRDRERRGKMMREY